VEQTLHRSGQASKTTIDRSIRAENKAMLLRRWKIAKSAVHEDVKTVNRWFAGQRAMLEILSVLDESKVLYIADCGTPLFSVQVPRNFELLDFPDFTSRDAFEKDGQTEVFMALATRLDALRSTCAQACMLYNITPFDAKHLMRHGPHELLTMSTDPVTQILPAVSDAYFLATAQRIMSDAEKTVFASVSRRQKTVVC